MKPRRAAALVLVFVLALGTPVPARASIFGEENVILGNILAQEVKDSLQLAEAVVTIRQTLGVMRDAAAFARNAVQTVQNIALIVKDPVGWLKANAIQFAHAWPELQDLQTDVVAIKEMMRSMGDPMHYDPWAFAHMLQDLRETQKGAYELVVRAVDQWGISSVHDEMLAQLREDQQRAAKVISEIAEASLIGQMTPQAAASYSAKSAAITAKATVELAAIQQEILRIMKLRLIGEVEDINRARVLYHDGAKKNLEMIPDDWNLPTTLEVR